MYATGLGLKAFWFMGVLCMIPECFQVSLHFVGGAATHPVAFHRFL
jgi:hypothetical protein